MTEPDADHDTDLSRLWSAPTLGAAVAGFVLLLLAWPLTRLRRRQSQ